MLVVTLDRASKRNAVDAEMTAALDVAFEELADDDALRVAVLTARGPVFCAGSDLRAGPGAPTPHGGEYGVVRRRRTKPVIAAVQGPALGGGFELVLACDLVVAVPEATFALPEAGLGRIPNAGGLFRTLDRLPRTVALELLAAGGRLAADRAYDLGLVNRLSEPERLLDDAMELAYGVCRNSPGSVAATLDAVRAYAAAGEGAGWEATAAALERTRGSADRAEGDRAFAERRPPAWAVPTAEV